MKYRNALLLTLIFPQLSFASDFSGFLEFSFVSFVVFPALVLESIFFIGFSLNCNFRKKKNMVIAISISLTTLSLGLLAMHEMISYKNHNDADVIFIVKGLFFTGFIACVLPITQYLYLSNNLKNKDNAN